MTSMLGTLRAANTPPPDPRELADHFAGTYFALRLGLAVLAFVFPVFLWAYGALRHGLPLQASMSSYFWAAGTVEQCAEFPMRTFFVGFLFAIAAGLMLYSGLTKLENRLLNVASLCSGAIAIFPEPLGDGDPPVTTCEAVRQWAAISGEGHLHFVVAVALFALLAIVAWRCAARSLVFLPARHAALEPWFRRLYGLLALLMGVGPLAVIGVLNTVIISPYAVFFAEAIGIWIFGTYWAVKTWELSLSRLEESPGDAVQAARSGKAPHANDAGDGNG